MATLRETIPAEEHTEKVDDATTWSLKLSRDSKKALKPKGGLPTQQRKMAEEFLKRLKADPYQAGGELLNNSTDTWKFKPDREDDGNREEFRIIYRVDDENRTVYVTEIAARGDVKSYKGRRR